mgnify:CR=1 FL=1
MVQTFLGATFPRDQHSSGQTFQGQRFLGATFPRVHVSKAQTVLGLSFLGATFPSATIPAAQNLLCWNPGGYFLVPFVSCHHFIATNRILNALFQMNMLTSLRRKMTTFRGTIESVLPKILFSSFLSFFI